LILYFIFPQLDFSAMSNLGDFSDVGYHSQQSGLLERFNIALATIPEMMEDSKLYHVALSIRIQI